jgi:hypothetical protein
VERNPEPSFQVIELYLCSRGATYSMMGLLALVSSETEKRCRTWIRALNTEFRFLICCYLISDYRSDAVNKLLPRPPRSDEVLLESLPMNDTRTVPHLCKD